MSNSLAVTGTIKLIGETQQGTSKSSGKSWKKTSFVITMEGDYPKDAQFIIFGEEKVDNFVKFNKVGQRVDVSFNIESREYNGKYYTDLNAWKVFANKGTEAAPAAEANSDALPF